MKVHLHQLSRFLFLLFFLVEPGPYKIMTDPDPGGPKTNVSYGSGSTTLSRSGPKSVQKTVTLADSVYYTTVSS